MPARDDLLQPTLDARDDLAGVTLPFRPSSLVVAAFFGGPLVAGWLFAWNFRKLGEPRKAVWCFAVFLVLTAAVMTYAGLALDAFSLDRELRKESSGAVRMTTRVVAVVAGLVAAGLQRRRFRAFESSGQDPARALAPALLTMLAAFVVQFLVVLLVFMARGEA